MPRPEILGLTLSQWGFLILAAMLLPAGWVLLCAALRLGRGVRRAGLLIVILVVLVAAVLMIATA